MQQDRVLYDGGDHEGEGDDEPDVGRVEGAAAARVVLAVVGGGHQDDAGQQAHR